MVIETTLSREQFIRLSIWRHIQRKTFYFWALTCAALTAFAILRGPQVLLVAAWLPFLLYLLLGIVTAFKQVTDKTSPLFLPTRYEFTDKGVAVSSQQGNSQLKWSHFAAWKVIAGCYVLVLAAGPIVAIPKSAVPVTQMSRFEGLLKKHVG